MTTIKQRIENLEWQRISEELNTFGWSLAKHVLSPEECNSIASLYGHEEGFRSRVVMARHGFGKGEYKYFSYPLPKLVAELRTAFYSKLVPVANRWNALMGIDMHYPDRHAAYIEQCHTAGQNRPTPLLLQYGPDDYNCLHQDLYGEQIFPLQAAFLLSEPGKDFEGGEFVLTEQRPRMQTRAEVIPLTKGDAVIFAVHNRPQKGTKGYYCVNMRHGISKLRQGHRYTLGIIFHDAQ
ncbi:MAG TPA: 2OG-Fe(II) oxygenase [Rickettsiales bacterium]|nr:2OG-Fe(II) oxygenase [Rickettsiales bacterium]